MLFLIKIKRKIKFALIYKMDFCKQMRYTTFKTGYRCSEEKLLAHLVVKAHTIEKGLTMPQKRYNFGQNAICEILSDLRFYAKSYNVNEERFVDVVGIIKEYGCWHKRNAIDIENKVLKEGINWLEENYPSIAPVPQLYNMSKDEFFEENKGDFKTIALTRHTCRNLSGEIPNASLQAALELAMTAPSTCNRQSIRLHIIEGGKILGIQSGNRGFGHLANKFILITSDLSDWPGGHQRNAPYVDGGIYLMNLLYALHYYGIGACTLNMYLDEHRTQRLHKELDIPENEVPIALIAIGIPPQIFDVARSIRRNYKEIVKYHQK